MVKRAESQAFLSFSPFFRGIYRCHLDKKVLNPIPRGLKYKLFHAKGAYMPPPLGILLQRSLKCTQIYANSYISNLSYLWVIEKESSTLSQKMWSWRRKKNLWREMRGKNSAVSKRFFKSRQIFLGENKTYNP